LKGQNSLCQPAVFWRREIHDEFGYFDESLHYALDYEFWLRVGKHLPFHYLEYEYLAKSRLHPLAKTIKYPLKAKWENLQVKHRHNQWIDIESAFEYCGLVARNETEEGEDQARFAEKFLQGMQEIDKSFDIRGIHTWKMARIEMAEMAAVSKPPKIRNRDNPSILVDISLFQPGGVHGGIKQAIYSLLKEIENTDRCSLTLIITQKLREEVEETFGTSFSIAICDENTTSESLIKDYHPDLLFCPLPSIRFHHSSIPLVFLSPDLLHIDYPDALEPEDREYRHNLFIEAREKASLFLTVSRFSRERLIQAYDMPHRKVWVLPHALPHGKTNRQSKQIPDQQPYFLYPANLWAHKNHKTLLVAYKNYSNHTKRPWKLVLTGHPDSGNSHEIKRLINTLGLEDFVDYRGYLSGDEYDAVWSSAGALVFPSNYEGFGLPLLEAMESGIPIIAANLPSLKEVAESAALYINQRSPDSIAKALRQISSDKNMRDTLIEKGRERLKLFDWKKPAETFMNLVVNLLKGKDEKQK
jgi:glycosyltransferase involved in cell wall biosynthesis